MTTLDQNAPILVGIGVVNQRFDDHREAKEPLALMVDAARAAEADAGAPGVLTQLDRIYTPKGRWKYTNPAGAIARSVGADHALSSLAHIGVLQQSLIGDACRRIADGEISSAAVIGGEAGYRVLRATIAGEAADEQETPGEPDEVLKPHVPLRNGAEHAAGLTEAVGAYAIIESAFRAAHGWSVDDHRDRLARLYADFSRIAGRNPFAWSREPVDVGAIRNPSPKNPMLAFPYTKRHVSSWNVDQASALIFCSAAKAESLGIPRSRWVRPLASSEANFMMDLSVRPSLAEVPGARIAGLAALKAAGVASAALDLLDLYTCFPVAVEVYAEALGIPLDRPDLTVTGGMPFAGGPLNNYVLQATCRMAQMLRDRPGDVGLVTSVSGILTKQGFGVWTGGEARAAPFNFLDVTEEVRRSVNIKSLATEYAGPARIAGYTVLHPATKPPRAVVVADIDQERRAISWSEDPAVTSAFEGGAEFVGRPVSVNGSAFRLC